jgi:hypothetical protein
MLLEKHGPIVWLLVDWQFTAKKVIWVMLVESQRISMLRQAAVAQAVQEETATVPFQVRVVLGISATFPGRWFITPEAEQVFATSSKSMEVWAAEDHA